MSNVFGPKKPLFGPYTYRTKQNSNGDTLIAVYHGSKRIAHIDAFWAYSMRALEEHEENEARRGTGRAGERGRRLVCATDLRALGAEGKYPNVLRVGHAFMDDDAYKGKGIGRAMYEAMMVEGFAVRQTRIGGQPGPMFLVPDECGGAGNTSADAKRVWASLVRDYPSQGTSIRVDAPPVIGSKMRTNPRRRNLDGSASPLRWYVRFGDPRTVKGGRSVIHDPEAYAFAEEPALYDFLGESPPRLQSEGGISSYEVLAFDGDKVVARIPVGFVTFSGQVGGFLEERILRDNAWVFRGREVGRGTDGEPLVDASSIHDVRYVGTKNLWGTDRHDDAPPPSSWKRLLDLYDVRDMRHRHDMGYDEFFHKRASEVLRKDITDYIDGLRSRFTTREQVKALDALEASWLEQYEDDHGRQMNPRRRNPSRSRR
jgi:hypothetical protein